MVGKIGRTATIVTAVLLLLGLRLAVGWIQKGRKPEETQPLKQSLSSLPMRLGVWSGHDELMDSRVGAAVNAVDVVNRQYVEDLGSKISMQVAAFATNDFALPHDPRVCYGQTGWRIVKREKINLRVDAETTQPAMLLLLEREHQRIFVLFWFQFGKACVTESDELRQVQWGYFGQKSWPPLIKVLIQINASDLTQAEKSLRIFAESILGWTQDLSR